jgi:hypothetical protein
MRSLIFPAMAVLCLLASATNLCADEKANAVIDKAIAAQGGGEKLKKLRSVRIAIKGTAELSGGLGPVPVEFEDSWQMPGRYKTTARLTYNGMPVTSTQIIDGDTGWVTISGQTQQMPEAAMAEMKEQKYAEDLDRLLGLKEKAYTLTSVEGPAVDSRPTVGVKVASKGHRDVTLYFDAATGLLLKRQQQVLDGSGKLVGQEVVFSDYQEKDGIKHWHKITLYGEGKKLLEGAVTKLEFVEKFDDREFAKP